MAAVRHLGFSKVKNFNFRSHSETQYASPYQILRRSVKPLRRYGRFSIFQDGRCRHLGFWKFQILTVVTLKRVELRLRAKFCRNRSNRSCDMDFSIFQDSGRPPSWIFKSWKFQLLVSFGGPVCVKFGSLEIYAYAIFTHINFCE